MPKITVEDQSNFLLAPMPGLLVKLQVKEGEKIKNGQELAVIEAMKMENVLRAESDATICHIACKCGDSLEVDQVIMEFDVSL